MFLGIPLCMSSALICRQLQHVALQLSNIFQAMGHFKNFPLAEGRIGRLLQSIPGIEWLRALRCPLAQSPRPHIFAAFSAGFRPRSVQSAQQSIWAENVAGLQKYDEAGAGAMLSGDWAELQCWAAKKHQSV